MAKKLVLPLSDEDLAELRSGDSVLLTGVIYVARDAAHKIMMESMDRGQPLPFDIRGQVLYYMGPSPAKPGQPIGSAGPTTSGRMDGYAPRLISAGLKGMIGKGKRSPAVRQAMKDHKAVYLAAVGGAGALVSKSIKRVETVAYADLGAEALLRVYAEDFPAIVINDIYGRDQYDDGKTRYQVRMSPANDRSGGALPHSRPQ